MSSTSTKTVSFSNTPQASDDIYGVIGDESWLEAGNYLELDVMANDAGGKAKVLWSLDNGSDDGSLQDLLSDLTSQDQNGAVAGYTDNGAELRIVDGKVRIYLGDPAGAYAQRVSALAQGEVLEDFFYYAIRLGNGTLSYARVTFSIVGSADGPVVDGPVLGRFYEDGPLIPLDALATATHPDGAPLHVTGLPSELPPGVQFDVGSQSFTLDPGHQAYQSLAEGDERAVEVHYTISDGVNSVAAVVRWTIVGTNDAPQVHGVATAEATQDGPAVSLHALAHVSDPDQGDQLQVLLGPDDLPDGVSYDPQSQTFSLNPAAGSYRSLGQGQQATVTVNYQVSDGRAVSDASVSWTVTGINDVPTFVPPKVLGVFEDGKPVSRWALAGVSDVDGDNLEVILRADPLPPGVSYDADLRVFTLDPNDDAYQVLSEGQVQLVTVVYDVSDGMDTTEARVTWRVIGTNDAPVFEGADTGEAVEDGEPVEMWALAGWRDDDDGSELEVVDVPEQLPDGVTWNPLTQTFTLDPSVPAYQSLAEGEQISVTVDYGVSDGFEVVPASVSWVVAGTNDAPIQEEVPLRRLTEDGAPASLNALSFASDPDGDPLTVVDVPATLPDGVTFSDAGGKFLFTLDPSAAAYQSLAQGQQTTVTVEYGISDGLTTTPAVVRWTVTGTNDAPVATGQAQSNAVEGGPPVAILALGTFTDVDQGDVLSVVNVPVTLPDGVSWNANNRSFTLDPSHSAYRSLAAGETVAVVVHYGVSDGIDTTPATASWTVTGVNSPPALDLDSTTPGVHYAAAFHEMHGPDTGDHAVYFSNLSAGGATITDADSARLQQLTVSLAQTSVAAGDELRVFGQVIDLTAPAGTTGIVDISGWLFRYSISDGASLRTVTFTNPQAPAVATPVQGFQDLLSVLQYNNSSDEPIDGSVRVFRVSVSDGQAWSATARFTVTVSAEEDSPDTTPPAATLTYAISAGSHEWLAFFLSASDHSGISSVELYAESLSGRRILLESFVRHEGEYENDQGYAASFTFWSESSELRGESWMVGARVYDPAGNVTTVWSADQFRVESEDFSEWFVSTPWTPGEVINGTAADDELVGTERDDVIRGGPGADVLTGGAGRDTFVFRFDDVGAVDVITDFVIGEDVLLLSFDGRIYSVHVDPYLVGQSGALVSAWWGVGDPQPLVLLAGLTDTNATNLANSFDIL